MSSSPNNNVKKSQNKNTLGIEDLRLQIDSVDQEILKLISSRGGVAKKIGEIKKSLGKKIYAPAREKQIFESLRQKNSGPYADAALFRIYREIISATRALEEPTTVAFLGPEATFTHMAAVKHFGSSAMFAAQVSIADVFSEVEKGSVDSGVVPVENSTEGVVNYTLDKFVESDLNICSEIILPIAHNLVSHAARLSDVKKVFSHPQALAQCRNWLAHHLPGVDLVETQSTAQATKLISGKKECAAIASQLAADLGGLNILAKNVQDQTQNFTRFLVISKTPAEKTGCDKTSFVLVTKDKVGVLYKLLKPLSDRKINMTKIESRPLKRKVWEYMFFIDIDGHVQDKKVSVALQELKRHCDFFRVLGSYPKA